MSLNSKTTESTAESCIETIGKLCVDLLHLVGSVEKGSGSEITVRLRNVESEISSLKQQIKSIPNINSDEVRQREQIASLYRQIRLKDELIKSLASYDIIDGLRRMHQKEVSQDLQDLQPQSPSQVQVPAPQSLANLASQVVEEAKKNEHQLVCQICGGRVLPPGTTSDWSDEEVQLPLPRQQRTATVCETEAVTGFWKVADMFDFDNVGFTRAVDGKRYLSCADCDYGPIGYVDPQTNMNCLALSRVTIGTPAE